MLVVFEPARHECCFISHNWWTRPDSAAQTHDAGAPDVVEGPDKNLKHRVCCRGLETLIADGVFDAAKEVVVWMGIPTRLWNPRR